MKILEMYPRSSCLRALKPESCNQKPRISYSYYSSFTVLLRFKTLEIRRAVLDLAPRSYVYSIIVL